MADALASTGNVVPALSILQSIPVPSPNKHLAVRSGRVAAAHRGFSGYFANHPPMPPGDLLPNPNAILRCIVLPVK